MVGDNRATAGGPAVQHNSSYVHEAYPSERATFAPQMAQNQDEMAILAALRESGEEEIENIETQKIMMDHFKKKKLEEERTKGLSAFKKNRELKKANGEVKKDEWNLMVEVDSDILWLEDGNELQAIFKTKKEGEARHIVKGNEIGWDSVVRL